MMICNIFDSKEVHIGKLSMTKGLKHHLHHPN
jgi:hypothetical protein